MPGKDREDLRNAVQSVRHFGGSGKEHEVDVVPTPCGRQRRRQGHHGHYPAAFIRAGEAPTGGYGADDKRRRVRSE
jgi:hypothetical protein